MLCLMPRPTKHGNATRRRRTIVGGLALAVLGAARTGAHDYRGATIHVGHPWAPVPTSPESCQIYMALINRGDRQDRLVGATSPIARRGAIIDDDARTIDLAPGRPVALRPGGRHIRLDGLTRRLIAGGRFELALHFAVAPPLDVEVMVEDTPAH